MQCRDQNQPSFWCIIGFSTRRKRPSYVLFGPQGFSFQYKSECSTARSGAHITGQASRYLRETCTCLTTGPIYDNISQENDDGVLCPKWHMFCAIDPFQCCKVLLVGKIQNTYASYAASILMYFYVSWLSVMNCVKSNENISHLLVWTINQQ